MRGNRGNAGIRWRRGQGSLTLRSLVLAAATLAVTAACSAPSAGPAAASFTPGADPSGASGTAAAGPSGGTGADDFVMPPFGSRVRVTMTDWLPAAGSPLIPAVVAVKNFFLAYYYAQYLGGKDSRWTAYTAGTAQQAIGKTLTGADVTGLSFTGSLKFGGMSAAKDPKLAGYTDVYICVDTSGLTDTLLPSGKADPSQPPASQDDFREMAYVARGSTGRWYVSGLGNYATVPVAKGCAS